MAPENEVLPILLPDFLEDGVHQIFADSVLRVVHYPIIHHELEVLAKVVGDGKRYLFDEVGFSVNHFKLFQGFAQTFESTKRHRDFSPKRSPIRIA
jgi:hypothetical protein